MLGELTAANRALREENAALANRKPSPMHKGASPAASSGDSAVKLTKEEYVAKFGSVQGFGRFDADGDGVITEGEWTDGALHVEGSSSHPIKEGLDADESLVYF